jgi:preprotein translocase subunit SecA
LVEYQREGYDMFMAMLDGLKEESVGFLFNVTVEAVPSPQVAPVEAPEGLEEFATAAAVGTEGGTGGTATTVREEAPTRLRAKGIDNEAPAMTYSGPAEDGSAAVQRNGGDGKAPAGVPGGASRRERRAAARQQGRGTKSPKSVKRR